MAIEKTIKLYTFEELRALGNQKAMDKALDWLRQGVDYVDWWDSEFETWKDALDQIGFCEADIRFSGFSSQGDGASFTARVDIRRLIDLMSTPIEGEKCIKWLGTPLYGHDEDFRPWLVHHTGFRADPKQRKLLRVIDNLEASVKRTSFHYVHEHTCKFEAEFNDSGEWVSMPNPRDSHWKTKQPRLRALFESWQKDAEGLRIDLCRAIFQGLEKEYEYCTDEETLAEEAEANNYTFRDDGGWERV